MKIVNIKTPLDEKTVESLEAGDQVFITGVIYSARDSAHKRLVEALDRKKSSLWILRINHLLHGTRSCQTGLR